MLSDPTGRLHARVRADGSLSSSNALGEHRGSIHQGGAAICRIFGTSGTSGRPKFVPASHDLLANRVLAKSIALKSFQLITWGHSQKV